MQDFFFLWRILVGKGDDIMDEKTIEGILKKNSVKVTGLSKAIAEIIQINNEEVSTTMPDQTVNDLNRKLKSMI